MFDKRLQALPQLLLSAHLRLGKLFEELGFESSVPLLHRLIDYTRVLLSGFEACSRRIKVALNETPHVVIFDFENIRLILVAFFALEPRVAPFYFSLHLLELRD